MTRPTLLLLAFLVLLPTVAKAQTPESTTQMSLATSSKFHTRLVYLMVQQARTVKAEALATVCHTARSAYASDVINDPGAKAPNAAIMIVGGVNLIGTVVPNSNNDLIDSSATDAAILSQIATFWAALAKCDTGS